MTYPKTNLPLQLQLFSENAGDTGVEGTSGVTASAAEMQIKGVKSNPLADIKYGIQDDVSAAEIQGKADPVNRNAEFEQLIKGEYKDLYDARMQKTVQERLKNSKETVEKYNSLQPILEILSKKYGVDVGDIEALNKAIEEDDSYFEDEALEKGISVEELKRVKRIERENAELTRQIQEQQKQENAAKIYSAWLQQADETKRIYPSFDLDVEMQNKSFVDLLRAHIPVRTAYEVIHKDDIVSGAMQFTAKTVEQKLTNKIASNSSRPSENGLSSQGAALTKSDVSQLDKLDIREVIRRVQRGEKIRF